MTTWLILGSFSCSNINSPVEGSTSVTYMRSAAARLATLLHTTGHNRYQSTQVDLLIVIIQSATLRGWGGGGGGGGGHHFPVACTLLTFRSKHKI